MYKAASQTTVTGKVAKNGFFLNMWLCEWKDEHLFSRTSIICSVREGSKVVISIRTRAKTCCGVISRDTHSFQLAQHGHRSPEQIQMSQNFDPSNLPWPKPVSESSRPVIQTRPDLVVVGGSPSFATNCASSSVSDPDSSANAKKALDSWTPLVSPAWCHFPSERLSVSLFFSTDD